MKIGIDLGATKIESVVIEDKGSELYRNRIASPKDYKKTISEITKEVKKIENKYERKLSVGVCHPGSTNLKTGLIQNSFNSPWLNNRAFSEDISKSLDRKILCENDANCFALSEATDGSAKNYKTVFGIILGSGCGGGLIINKKIFVDKERDIIKEIKKKLSRSLSLIINVIDPDAIVFGGGLSNEIESLDEIKKNTEKYLSDFNNIENIKLKTLFLKAKYGDASGVRGAAILSKQNFI